MFRWCTNIVKSPVLPARKTVNNCYNGMFEGCTKLAEITFNGDKLDNTVSKDWVKDIYTYGKFISLNVDLPKYNYGFTTIPYNWGCTVYDYMDDLGKTNYFTITNTTKEDKTISFFNYGCENIFIKKKGHWIIPYLGGSYSQNGWNGGGHKWDLPIKAGESIKIAHKADPSMLYINGYKYWATDSDLTGINFSGNIWSLYFGNKYDELTKTPITGINFFKNSNCTINGLSLGNMELKADCYNGMFSGCTKI